MLFGQQPKSSRLLGALVLCAIFVASIIAAWTVFFVLFFQDRNLCTPSLPYIVFSASLGMLVGGIILGIFTINRRKVFRLLGTLLLNLSFLPLWMDPTVNHISRVIPYMFIAVACSLFGVITGGIYALRTTNPKLVKLREWLFERNAQKEDAITGTKPFSDR